MPRVYANISIEKSTNAKVSESWMQAQNGLSSFAVTIANDFKMVNNKIFKLCLNGSQLYG
jgi:hypothetical protein